MNGAMNEEELFRWHARQVFAVGSRWRVKNPLLNLDMLPTSVGQILEVGGHDGTGDPIFAGQNVSIASYFADTLLRGEYLEALPIVKPEEPEEKIEHPPHYGGADNPYETIKVLEAWFTPEQYAGFCVGNALKYLSRAGKKAGESRETDLKKAQWYLNRFLSRPERLR